MAKGQSHLLAEPPEGSSADWYARGYRDGTIYGAEQAVREAGALEAEVRGLLERVGHFVEEMQRRYGATVSHPDRWQVHPAYLRGVELFERQTSGGPTLQQRWAESAEAATPAKPPRLPSRSKGRRPKALRAEPDPGPTLTLGEPELPTEVELEPEAEARRAAGRAWRA